jgi:hypothetical protein
MPTSGGPGQPAIPRPIRAMPVTRATGMATPVSLSPNNNCPTSEGTTRSANPVAASPTAAIISTFLIAPISLSLLRWRPDGAGGEVVCCLLDGALSRLGDRAPTIVGARRDDTVPDKIEDVTYLPGPAAKQPSPPSGQMTVKTTRLSQPDTPTVYSAR